MKRVAFALGVALLVVPNLVSAQGDVRATPDSLFLPPHGDEGCWVSFFAGTNFGLPAAQLRGRSDVEAFESGPVLEPDLKHVGGQKFIAEARSIVVGPNARLIGYERPRFRDQALTIGPGRQVVDVAALDFHERVRSLEVRCE